MEWSIAGVPFSFSQPQILICLWLSLPLVLVFWFADRRFRKRFLLLNEPEHLKALSQQAKQAIVQFSPAKSLLKGACFLLALVFLLLALAGPRYGYEEQESKTSGVDMLIALDLSLSMQTEDVKPSRLVQARREILDLLGRLKGDRVGIIAFAGIAMVQCPLTSDYESLRLFLDHLDAGSIPSQGTSVASAMDLARQTFAKSSAVNSAGKVLLIISDGEDQDSGPLQAAQKLSEAGIALYVMGVGTEQGAPIPVEGGGFKKDESGQMVISKLNAASLKSIASAGGGRYVQSVPGEGDLDLIWNLGIQAEVQSSERSAGIRRTWHEYFQWALWAALFLLLLESLLQPWRTSRRHLASASKSIAQIFLLLFILGPIFATRASAEPELRLGQSQRERARQAYEKGDFKDAAKQFEQAEVESPFDEKLRYQRAVSQYRAGQYEEAEKGFSSLVDSKDAEISKRARFNLGNARAMQEKFEDAVDAFDQYTKDFPDEAEAKENLNWAKRMLEQKKDQQSSDNSQEKNDQKNQEKNPEQSQEKQNGQQNQQQSGEQEQASEEDGKKEDQSGQEEQVEKNETGEDQKKQADQAGQEQQAQEKDAEKAEPSQAKEGEDGKKANEDQNGNDAKIAGEPELLDQDGKTAEEASQAELRSEGQLSKEAAERLLRQLGDQADKIRIPIPRHRQPEQNSKRDW